jgi:hypothetical protein
MVAVISAPVIPSQTTHTSIPTVAEVCEHGANRASTNSRTVASRPGLGQHSIRVNDQWRVCFRWEGDDAHDVEICDYH